MKLNPLLPAEIVGRALDDLAAIAAVARRLPELERAVFGRIDGVQVELVRTREGVEGLQGQMAPIQQLPAVREAVEPLPGKLDDLKATVEPIAEITAVREAAEPLAGKMDELRAGIEPLDADMGEVRSAIDDIEPLVREVLGRLGRLDERLEALREDLSPLGELAEKLPGVRRR